VKCKNAEVTTLKMSGSLKWQYIAIIDTFSSLYCTN